MDENRLQLIKEKIEARIEDYKQLGNHYILANQVLEDFEDIYEEFKYKGD